MSADEELINGIRVVVKPSYDWVLFSNGTAIVFRDARPANNLEERAISLMKEFGPVYPGTSAGDMTIKHLEKPYGWLVFGHGPDMALTFILANLIRSIQMIS